MFKATTEIIQFFHLSNRTLLWSCSVRQKRVQARGGLVLQRSTAREEGVLEVIVEQAANGGHVDVSKAWETAGEVGGIVVRPEETPKLSIEDVLCLWSAEKKHIKMKLD